MSVICAVESSGPACETDTLEGILALSREMLAAAQAGDWEPLIVLEARRRGQIEAFFAQQHAVGDPQAGADVLRRIIDIDRQVMGMVAAARDGLATDLRQVNVGRNAQQAYRQFSR